MAEFRRYSTYLGLIISVYMVKWAFSRWDVCRLLTILEQYEQFYLHLRVYDILEGVNKCPIIKLSCSFVDDLHTAKKASIIMHIKHLEP